MGVLLGVFVGVAVGVAVGMAGVFVGVAVGVAVGMAGVFVGVAVGVLVGVAPGVLVGVAVGVLVGVSVGVAVGVLVGVSVGVPVGVLVGVAPGVFVGVAVGVAVGVSLGVTVGAMGVGVAVGVGVGHFLRSSSSCLHFGGFTGVAVGVGRRGSCRASALAYFETAENAIAIVPANTTCVNFRFIHPPRVHHHHLLSPYLILMGLGRAWYDLLMAGASVAIVGGGPCGLACARTLRELGHDNMVLLERAGHVGGLAASIVDPNGFTWDRGGHVVFSHYGEFDRLLADVIGDDVERHERSSFVRLGGEWIPYPLQNNLHRLPDQMAEEAIVGLIAAQHTRHTDGSGSADFGTWMDSMFGDGIVRLFMRPYNEKVWAHPASAMSSRWIAERVSTVDWRHAVRALVRRVDDEAWGPNNLFAFPKNGGTGEIFRRAAVGVSDRVRLTSGVHSVDLDRRRLVLESGETVEFDHLVWTGALDGLVERISSHVDIDVRDAARELVHNTVTVVGIGYETPLVDDRSWLYFPEPDVPFYRATNFAKYAAGNVPGGRTDRYSSWMTEIASSDWRPLDERDLASAVDAALRRHGLVPPDAPIASVHIDRVDYGYPVPTLGRDPALQVIQPWLMERGVLSRGRFGAWRYELGNMDHAVKMGVDAARWIDDRTPEEAWSL